MPEPSGTIRESFASQHSGADWLASALHVELTPLARKVADILGIVWRGIYHIDQKDLGAGNWTDPYFVTVRIYGDLSTYDFSRLTELVVLCHDGAIRLDISPRGMRHLELMFHQREREGSPSQRHPTLEQAAEAIRKLFPAPPPSPEGKKEAS